METSEETGWVTAVPNFRHFHNETPQIHLNTQFDAILKGYDFSEIFRKNFLSSSSGPISSVSV
jgi:hypothetical protein